jgi:hypothetical protein
VWIRRQNIGIKVATEADGRDNNNILMNCESGRFEPVIVEAHWEFPGDADACARVLTELFGRWDIVEPFERLHKGLEYVHNEKVLAS